MISMKKLVALALAAWVGAAGLLPAAQGGEAQDASAAASHPSVGQRIATWLRGSGGLPDEAVIVLISTLPIVELRGAIPAGHMLMAPEKSAPWTRRWGAAFKIFALAVVGNMIPVPIILWVLGPLSRGCMRYAWGRRFFDWLFARTRRKTANLEKYETLGLAIFVAIPLPATGAWTGAMAAFLMGMQVRHAMGSILLGVLVAGSIMTVLSLMGWMGALVAGVVLLVLAVGTLLQMIKREAPAAPTL